MRWILGTVLILKRCQIQNVSFGDGVLPDLTLASIRHVDGLRKNLGYGLLQPAAARRSSLSARCRHVLDSLTELLARKLAGPPFGGHGSEAVERVVRDSLKALT